MHFAHANGINLHHTWEGAPGPALVFVNGLGTDLRIWDEVVPHFSARCRIVRHDKRGHGLSDAPPGPYNLAYHADDLRALLDGLNIDEAVVVGTSVGGMVAMQFALDYPNRVKGLVLCGTAPKIGNTDFWEARIAAIKEQGMAKMGKTILERWFAPGYADEFPAHKRGFYHMLARMDTDGYIATCGTLRDCDLTPCLDEISVRTLVLCGAEDTATPPDLVRGLANGLPNARFELIDGAGHTPCVEQPDDLAAHIKTYLEEIGYGR